MTALATVWAYVKKYWSLVALVGGVVFAVVFMRKQGSDFAENLKKIQDLHDEELKKIQEVRAEEKRQHEENQRKLQEALATVQQHYDEAKKDLDAKKKAQIEDLVKKYKDDPDELAKRLSEATGFTIILP